MVRRGSVVVALALAAWLLAGCGTMHHEGIGKAQEPGMLEFYTTQSHWTSPGELSAMYDGVPDDVAGIVRAVQGAVLHGGLVWVYGFQPSDAQQGGYDVRATEDLLRRIKALDDEPLSVPRPVEKRLLVNCRQFAVLTCSILRSKGIPARARAGYARYTWGRGTLENHWVCEYWLAAQKRWVTVDAQMDDKLRKLMGIGFDTLDMPPGEFASAGEGWRLYRAGTVAADRFGLGGKDGWNAFGWKMVMPNVVCDTMALNKTELLPWDVPPYWDKAEGDMTAQDMALIDKAAELAADPERNWDEFRALYRDNATLRMPPDWKDRLPEAPAH